MSNYVQTTFFTPKDSLPPSDPGKTIFGAAYDVEFGNIATAISSKYDSTTISTAPIPFNIGTAALPGITFVGHTGTGLYSNAGGDLGLSANGVSRLVITAASGLVTASAGLTVSGAAFTSRGILDSAPSNALTISSGGNLVITTPGSGIALTAATIQVGATAAQSTAILSTRVAGNAIEFGHTNSAGFGSVIGADAGDGRPFLAFNSEAGTTTNTFRTRGIKGRVFQADLAGGFITGVVPTASADNQSIVQDLSVSTAGGVQIGVPTGGDPGAGGLNIQSNLQLGGNPIYAGIPQNGQSTNYQLVLSDANKHIFFSGAGAKTLTIPANASVAFPVGTAITIVSPNGGGTITINITTDNLQFYPSGATGSRSLAASGICTILKISSTFWCITGSGLT